MYKRQGLPRPGEPATDTAATRREARAALTTTGRTLAEKVWDLHLVRAGEGDEPDLLYIDLHLVHEVTSPQAFDGLRLAARPVRRPDLIYIDLHLVHEVTSPQAFDGLRLNNRPVRRPDLTIATEDHNVPTVDIDKPVSYTHLTLPTTPYV